MARSRPRDDKRKIRVTVSLKNSSKAQLIRVGPKPGDKTKGLIRFRHLTLICALGRSGIAMPKKEGDGRTPKARIPILFGIADKGSNYGTLIRTGLGSDMIRGGDQLGWCDAAGAANYNRAVRLPFMSSHETLNRQDGLYQTVLVLDWNMTKRAQGRGSAIFMHIARENYAPTEGCIALSPRDMRRLMLCIGQGAIVSTL
jgi:L,D-peptidoglycan transpeptidase YkuD (ErfK/YbiS/YcfS/YnhG family)